MHLFLSPYFFLFIFHLFLFLSLSLDRCNGVANSLKAANLVESTRTIESLQRVKKVIDEAYQLIKQYSDQWWVTKYVSVLKKTNRINLFSYLISVLLLLYHLF